MSDLNRGRQLGPRAVWRRAISQPAQTHHMCTFSKGPADELLSPALPSAVEGLHEG